MQESFSEYLKSIDTALTHSGKFHADDVFSAALIHLVNPKINVVRVNKVPEEFEGLVFDIGFGEFDHHQQEKKVREDGTPYAAFGLLFQKLGKEIMNEEEAEKFDEKFIEPLDLNDNFGYDHPIARVISNMNPCWDEQSDGMEEFKEAERWASEILKAELRQIAGRDRAKALVEEAMKEVKDGILILKQSMPWKKFVKETDIEFAIYPSNRGGFCAQAVPDDLDSKLLKCPFCAEWRGKTEEELKEISGIETISFCHSSGFLMSAGTVEDCIKACNISREVYAKQKEEQQKEVEALQAENVFLNCTMSQSEFWDDMQKTAAEKYGTIVDLTPPKVYSTITMEEIVTLADAFIEKIKQYAPQAVYCDGNTAFTYVLIERLQKENLLPVSATFKKNTDGTKRFVQFIEINESKEKE